MEASPRGKSETAQLATKPTTTKPKTTTPTTKKAAVPTGNVTVLSTPNTTYHSNNDTTTQGSGIMHYLDNGVLYRMLYVVSGPFSSYTIMYSSELGVILRIYKRMYCK